MTAQIPLPPMKRQLVAILRGIDTHETEAVVGALIEEGFEAIEIPLNSPNAFASIELAAKLAPNDVLIGAGTVLTPSDVDDLASAGGRLMVSPNIDVAVMEKAVAHGMVTMPGVLSPTEALLALKSGASGLKFFPASILGASGIKAIMAVLPPETVVAAVGGVSEADFGDYFKHGIRAFGMGSSLYQPGAEAEDVRQKAGAVIAAYDAASIA